jgi:BA14K-like protein
MTSLKTMLSAAAALALLVPMATPTTSFAEGQRGGRSGGAAFHGNAGGNFHANTGGNFRGNTAGNFQANSGGVRAGGTAPTANFAARPGGTARTANFAANAQAGRPTGGTWNGGRTGWTGGGDRTAWNGGRGEWRGDRDRGGRWWPGVAAGAAVGGAIAAGDAYAYYGGPGYYDYSDDYGYDEGVAAVPVPVGGDSVAYCSQRYRSYDPASGTYLGFDGERHPCP